MDKIEHLSSIKDEDIIEKINELIDVVNNKSDVIVIKVNSDLPTYYLKDMIKRIQYLLNNKGLNAVIIPVNDRFDFTVVSGDMKVINISGKDYTAEELENIAKEISDKYKSK